MPTITVSPSGQGGDWNSLSNAVNAAAAGDLIEIYGNWTGVTDGVAVTVSVANLTIMTRVGDPARQLGFNAATNYILQVATGAHCITVNATGLRLDGFHIIQASATQSAEAIRIGVASTVTIVNMSLRASGIINQQDGIYAGTINVTLNLENVCVTGFGRAGVNCQIFGASPSTQTLNGIGLTIWNNGFGPNSSDSGGINGVTGSFDSIFNGNFLNCVSVGNNFGDYKNGTSQQNGTNTWNFAQCFSGDASVTGLQPGAVNPQINVVITDGALSGAVEIGVLNITTSPADLRLQDNVLNDAQDYNVANTGAGLTVGQFTGTPEDVALTPRPQGIGALFDVGFFEVVAAAGTQIDVPVDDFTFTAEDPSVAISALVNVPNKIFTFVPEIPAIETSLALLVPVKDFVLDPQTPKVQKLIHAGGPVDFDLVPQVPGVFIGAIANVPVKDFTLTPEIPTVEADPAAQLFVPTKDFTLAAFAPVVGTGIEIVMPFKVFTLTAELPLVIAIDEIALFVPTKDFALTFPALLVEANDPNATGFDLNLTPPIEDVELHNWFVENFDALRQLLKSGETTEFLTADGKTIIVQGGIVKQVQ